MNNTDKEFIEWLERKIEEYKIGNEWEKERAVALIYCKNKFKQLKDNEIDQMGKDYDQN